MTHPTGRWQVAGGQAGAPVQVHEGGVGGITHQGRGIAGAQGAGAEAHCGRLRPKGCQLPH